VSPPRRRHALGCLLLCSLACAPARLDQRVAAYRRALAERDAGALLSVSDPELRRWLDEERLEHFLDENPATVARAWTETGTVTAVRATVEFASGARLRLQRRNDRWQVEEGPLVLPRLDTPEAALRTFIFASRGHLGMLRTTLPEAARERLSSDAALARHLTEIRPAIEALAAALPPDPHFVVEGDEARLSLGGGRVLRLQREGRLWRILDLE
jgi:hypothetical protein